MKLYLENKIPISFYKCKKPSFSNVRGRTWDYDKIYIDNIEYNAHLDTTWGNYCYVNYNGEWRKYKFYSNHGDKFKYHIDLFSVKKTKFTTKICN